ncbi:MAG: hypothetical protein QOF57_1658 [Frankiaceae bacterium]|nr:hypothetical protein [Frankiaceae bacterium]
MSLRPRVFPAIPLGGATRGAADLPRADIVVSGLEHGGPSFEVRTFLNNPTADARTEPTPDNGYAGSIYVYGYGQPLERAHGGPAESDSQPRMPMTRSIIATDAVRAAAMAGPQVSVTLVPVASDPPEPDVDLDRVAVSVVLVDEPPQDA